MGVAVNSPRSGPLAPAAAAASVHSLSPALPLPLPLTLPLTLPLPLHGGGLSTLTLRVAADPATSASLPLMVAAAGP